MTLKILNLFSGIGGNRKLWKDVEVTAIDNDPEICRVYQKSFPDDVVICDDALDYINYNKLDKFDLVWASPPCITHSRIQTIRMNMPDMSTLYGTIVWLRDMRKINYVVENVISWYTPAYNPKKIKRHYFWSSWDLDIDDFESEYKLDGSVYKMNKYLNMPIDLLNVRYSRKRQIIRNCIDPKLGNAIIESFRRHYRKVY